MFFKLIKFSLHCTMKNDNVKILIIPGEKDWNDYVTNNTGYEVN